MDVNHAPPRLRLQPPPRPAADAGQESRGNDLNNDGGPKDRENIRQLQELYGGGARPSWRYESSPSWRYQSAPSWRHERYGFRRDYRSDRRRSSPYFAPDPRPRKRYYRCVEGWGGQLYCERDTWSGW